MTVLVLFVLAPVTWYLWGRLLERLHDNLTVR